MSRLLFIFPVLFFLEACSPKNVPPQRFIEHHRLGIAAFSQPEHGWEFLSGGIPSPEIARISVQKLAALDKILSAEVLKKYPQAQGAKLVRNCQDVVGAEGKDFQISAKKYWQNVGRCLTVDTLVIPFVFFLQEREGGEWGITQPAHVILELHALDVRSGQMRHFYFDEEQKPLFDNLLKIGSFLERKGHWITVEELAAEAIKRGVKELEL